MIFAANWKLNLGPKEVHAFFTDWRALGLSEDLSKSCIFFPQNLSMAAALQGSEKLGVALGAQNICYERQGAFTGENSLAVAEELGLAYVLIGHSERRSLFAETDALLQKKMQLCLSSSLKPLLCIGETLEQREAGQTEAVVEQQLQTALHEIPETKDFLLAYEPVWAIGTGKVASPEMAEAVHAFVREWLTRKYSVAKSRQTSLLYGGSVKADNAAKLAKQPNIDGFLVGGASLRAQSFFDIISNCIS